MLHSSPPIQKQLSDVVSIIGKHDFPNKWPELIPQMVDKFKTGGFLYFFIVKFHIKLHLWMILCLFQRWFQCYKWCTSNCTFVVQKVSLRIQIWRVVEGNRIRSEHICETSHWIVSGIILIAMKSVFTFSKGSRKRYQRKSVNEKFIIRKLNGKTWNRSFTVFFISKK